MHTVRNEEYTVLIVTLSEMRNIPYMSEMRNIGTLLTLSVLYTIFLFCDSAFTFIQYIPLSYGVCTVIPHF